MKKIVYLFIIMLTLLGCQQQKVSFRAILDTSYEAAYQYDQQAMMYQVVGTYSVQKREIERYQMTFINHNGTATFIELDDNGAIVARELGQPYEPISIENLKRIDYAMNHLAISPDQAAQAALKSADFRAYTINHAIVGLHPYERSSSTISPSNAWSVMIFDGLNLHKRVWIDIHTGNVLSIDEE